MEGQALYERYATLELELNHCQVEPWETLDEPGQVAWNALAAEVDLAPIAG